MLMSMVRSRCRGRHVDGAQEGRADDAVGLQAMARLESLHGQHQRAVVGGPAAVRLQVTEQVQAVADGAEYFGAVAGFELAPIPG